jgi:hypothetical protein
MQKELYIIRGLPSEDYKTFGNRIYRLSEDVLEMACPEKLKICLTLKKPPRISIIPFKKNKIAVLSIYCKKGTTLKMVIHADGYAGGYAVEEALPVSYSKNWDDGEETPGACLLTLFHSKPGIDHDVFISRWHDGHTPLSLKLHPLWNYNRNLVTLTLTEGSTWYDGIVEEQVQTASDLLNPMRFFGPPHKVPLHMLQVFKDTRGFIDMRRIETYLASEIHLKS